MTPSLIVRPVAPHDLAQVAPLVSGIQRGEFAVPVTIDEQPDLLDPIGFFRHRAGDFWVALDGDLVIGTIGVLDVGGGLGVLRKMFVAAEYRGAAIGTAQLLLETVLAHVDASGLDEIVLGTTAAYHAAHRFYEKNDFAEVSVAELPAGFPRMAVDTKFYRRRLPGRLHS